MTDNRVVDIEDHGQRKKTFSFLRDIFPFMSLRDAFCFVQSRITVLYCNIFAFPCFPQRFFHFPALGDRFIHFHGCQVVRLVTEAAEFSGTLHP